MKFRDQFLRARRHWLAISSMVVIAAATSLLLSFTTKPTYHSLARVYLSADVQGTVQALYAPLFLTDQVQSFSALAPSAQILQPVIDELGLPETATQLAAKVTTTIPADTSMIQIEVRDADPHRAQRIAFAIGAHLARYIVAAETDGRPPTSPLKASMADNAAFDGTPIAPHIWLNLGYAVLLGLIAGASLAAAGEIMDRAIESQDDLEDAVALPVLAQIPADRDIATSPLATQLGSRAPRTEAFRILRTSLQFLDPGAPPKTFMIASPQPNEGRTLTAINLAAALAQSGRRTILVEADLRSPTIATLLDLDPDRGLISVLDGSTRLSEAIQHAPAAGIDILVRGPRVPNPAEVLQADVTLELLRELRAGYDAVVLDTSPLAVPDACVLAPEVDAIIIVARHAQTTRDQLRNALQLLHHSEGRVAGTVLNGTPPARGLLSDQGLQPYGHDIFEVPS